MIKISKTDNVATNNSILYETEAVIRNCSIRKVFIKISQNSQENTCARVTFLIKCIKKETLAEVFSCEFCETFKNTSFYRATLVAASNIMKQSSHKHTKLHPGCPSLET